jgi:hypothetical protein
MSSPVQILARTQTVVTDVFHSFLKSFHVNTGLVPKIRAQALLPHLSHFVIHCHPIIHPYVFETYSACPQINYIGKYILWKRATRYYISEIVSVDYFIKRISRWRNSLPLPLACVDVQWFGSHHIVNYQTHSRVAGFNEMSVLFHVTVFLWNELSLKGICMFSWGLHVKHVLYLTIV